jgi:DNA-binding NtrC family response regulator
MKKEAPFAQSPSVRPYPQKATNVKSILVVDDDFSMRRGMALMLQGQGYEVFEACDGTQALQMLGEKPIALAIVDLFIPSRDGIEVADEIEKQSPDTKVLLLTAFGEHPRAQEAQQIFKENYLEKTALEQTLLKKVQKVLQDSNS